MYTSACIVNGLTPYEVVISKKPHFSHIRRFGAVAYVHVREERRKSKFHARATVGVHVGCHHGNSYRVWIPDNGKVVSSCDVIFDEMRHHDSIAELSNSTKIETDANIDDDTDISDSCDDKDRSVSPHP